MKPGTVQGEASFKTKLAGALAEGRSQCVVKSTGSRGHVAQATGSSLVGPQTTDKVLLSAKRPATGQVVEEGRT